jgi:hypothetical protein
MLETFTTQTFLPLVHDTFRLSHEQLNQDLALELTSVREMKDTGPVDARVQFRRTPFALIFRGPREIILPQRIYRLEHATLGAFELFIVPVGADAQGVDYEAIFT